MVLDIVLSRANVLKRYQGQLMPFQGNYIVNIAL